MRNNIHHRLIIQTGLLVFLIIGILALSACSNMDKGYHENGKLKFEIEKRDGKYNGLAVFYYNNGLKQHECFYRNDSLEGKSTRWFVNGKVYSIEHFKDNRLHGLAQYFDMNGKKLREENYYHDTLHGQSYEYYTSGQIRIQGSYHMGLFDGKWLYFEDDGVIVGMGEYVKGTGKQRAWYRNSTLMREVNYLENEKHGKETWYNTDGTISKIVSYEFGNVISTESF